jgi:hypothetical protein
VKKFLALVLVLAASPAAAQNTIIIPASRPSTPSDGWGKFDKPVAVKLANGKAHTVVDCAIGGIRGYDWTEMGLSHAEASSVIVLASSQGHNPAPGRAELERDKKPYNFYLVPFSAIDTFSIEPYKDRGLRAAKVTFRDPKRKPLDAYLDLRMGTWSVSGKEDLGGFGKGDFSESLSFGKVAEVKFGEVPALKVEPKSAVTATITQVGGARHELTDVRMKDQKFEFRKGSTRLEVPLDKVARIDVLKGASPGYVCKVKLTSGAEQELEMYSYKFCGKGPEFYEVLETYSIRSVEFGTAAGEKKK